MEPAPEPLVAQLSQRVAARYAPPPPPRQDRAAILDRLTADLHRRGVGNRNRCLTLAQLCLALAAGPPRNAAQLAAELGLCRQTVVLAFGLLMSLAYVAYERAGLRRNFRLTTEGEDWLLPLLTGVPTAPPAQP